MYQHWYRSTSTAPGVKDRTQTRPKRKEIYFIPFSYAQAIRIHQQFSMRLWALSAAAPWEHGCALLDSVCEPVLGLVELEDEGWAGCAWCGLCVGGCGKGLRLCMGQSDRCWRRGSCAPPTLAACVVCVCLWYVCVCGVCPPVLCFWHALFPTCVPEFGECWWLLGAVCIPRLCGSEISTEAGQARTGWITTAPPLGMEQRGTEKL